jgi:hypothetical protein
MNSASFSTAQNTILQDVVDYHTADINPVSSKYISSRRSLNYFFIQDGTEDTSSSAIDLSANVPCEPL